MSQLRVEGVTKIYAETLVALDNLSLSLNAGELVALLGPSGCGKTTLLRLVAGLEQVDAGQIYFNDINLVGIPVHERSFGFMFQDFALFPHRTVAQNIAFGLKMASMEKSAVDARVDKMLALVNLQGYHDRSVIHLSGGEQQRVALARSLAPQPQLLMLDEPLGSLDRTLRSQLADEIRSILQTSGVTALYVTHDQEEAFTVADRVAVMNKGRVVQDGSPLAVYAQPESVFVARFFGFKNIIPATIAAETPHLIQTPIGCIADHTGQYTVAPGNYPLLLRPDGAQLLAIKTAMDTPGFSQSAPSESYNRPPILLTGYLSDAWYHGDRYRVRLAVPIFQQLPHYAQFPDSVLSNAQPEDDETIYLQFELVVLQPAARNRPPQRLQLPAPRSIMTVLLHPDQIVVLPNR